MNYVICHKVCAISYKFKAVIYKVQDLAYSYNVKAAIYKLSADTHGCRACQPRSPGPMEPECHKPMDPLEPSDQGHDHWSQLVKGSNPLPPGDPIWALKVALWLPYAPLMPPVWLPSGCLTPPLRPPYGPLPPPGCANVARPRDDFH